MSERSFDDVLADFLAGRSSAVELFAAAEARASSAVGARGALAAVERAADDPRFPERLQQRLVRLLSGPSAGGVDLGDANDETAIRARDPDDSMGDSTAATSKRGTSLPTLPTPGPAPTPETTAPSESNWTGATGPTAAGAPETLPVASLDPDATLADEATALRAPPDPDATQASSSAATDRARHDRDATRASSPTGSGISRTDETAPARSLGDSQGPTAATGASTAMGAAKALVPGDVIKERFVIESVIGKGGMGMVLKALDRRKQEAQDRNPHVALKVLSERLMQHPDSVKILQREARKAQDLAHPNIITVFDFDRDGANIYMTMEMLSGDTLDHVLKRRFLGKGVPFEQAIRWIKGMGAALTYAHQKNIIHSDFKPGNVFVTEENQVKVLDFGIARAGRPGGDGEGAKAAGGKGRASAAGAGETSATAGDTLGDTTHFDPGMLGALTPAYASLEMFAGEDPDPRDDIYALACVAYELLAGRHPYNRTPADQAYEQRLRPTRIKGLTKRQWRVLSRGLALERAKRTPTVAELIDGLQRPVFTPVKAAVAVLTVALVSVSAWGIYVSTRAPEDRVVFTPLEAQPQDIQAQVLDKLEFAGLLEEDGLSQPSGYRLIGVPPGNNAYELYQDVLALHPGNRTAYEGLERVRAAVVEKLNDHLNSEQLEDIPPLAEWAVTVEPENERFERLRARLAERAGTDR